MNNKPVISIMWFRRDLRLDDNAALYHALKSGDNIVPVFVFDTSILDNLEDKKDRRIMFIYEALEAMQIILQKQKTSLEVYYDTPQKAFQSLLQKYTIKTVFANEDYEQYAIDRDEQIKELLRQHNAELKLYKDHVIFSKNEIVKKDGKPYTVFTPYSKVWLKTLTHFYIKSYTTEKYSSAFYQQKQMPFPSLESMGFEKQEYVFPSSTLNEKVVHNYHTTRDQPAIEGTSRIGVHLRFGTISIRKVVAFAKENNAVFLKELIWRDFYQMILWQSDLVRKGKAFKPKFDDIRWRNNEDEFQRWCDGQTGYAIVDAGMRQLNATGYMHNRVRMITASFLSKHLLIDWRWGEAYFAKILLDYDYAANNGGWQWCAGTGADPSPYFRVFNPDAQTKKWDKKLEYVKRWVPEYKSSEYKPIIDHTTARQRALQVYRAAVKKV